MEHCLSSHVHGDGSVENPFTLEGGDLRVSVMFDLTDPYPIEPVRVGGGVIHGQCATRGCKRSDRVSTKRLVPIKDKIFLKEEGTLLHRLHHRVQSLSQYLVLPHSRRFLRRRRNNRSKKWLSSLSSWEVLLP